MEKYIIIFLILATIYYIQTQLKSIEDFAINTLVKIAKNLMIDELQISNTSDIVVSDKQSSDDVLNHEGAVVVSDKQSVDKKSIEIVSNKQSINVKNNVAIVEPLIIDGTKLNWFICC